MKPLLHHVRRLVVLSVIGLGVLPGARGQLPAVCRLPSLENQATHPIRMRTLADPEAGPVTVRLSGVPGGFDIANGDYTGWSLEKATARANGAARPVKLWSSYGPLPEAWQQLPWDKVNFLLNHKSGTAADVQSALRHFAGSESPLTSEARAMIDEAGADGAGFLPEPGQITVVIADAGQTQPLVLIEVVLPLPQPVCPVLDFLWDDLNYNGTHDAGEPAIVGARVVLTDCAGRPLASTITSVGGFFSFDLPASSMPLDLRIFIAGRTNFVRPTGLLGSFGREGFTACFRMMPDCEWRIRPEPGRVRPWTPRPRIVPPPSRILRRPPWSRPEIRAPRIQLSPNSPRKS